MEDIPERGSSREARRARRSCGGANSASRLYLSLLLIGAGVLLFLSNLGLFSIQSVWELWPLVLIALGLARWNQPGPAGDRVWSVLLIFFGVVFLLISLGLLHLHLHGASWPIAVLLILAGVLALTKNIQPSWKNHHWHTHQWAPAVPKFQSMDTLTDTTVLGSVNRRVETSDFRGGTLSVVMGSIELDLRRAQIRNPEEPVTIEASCVMGSIKLRIPESWRVSTTGVPAMGSYEDKTIPISRDEAITGRLLIKGAVVMGSIEIEN